MTDTPLNTTNKRTLTAALAGLLLLASGLDAHAEVPDQPLPKLPPSPWVAINMALNKASDAMNQARILDARRKNAWIEARQTVFQARKAYEQQQQESENTWFNPTLGYEDLADSLEKEDKSKNQMDDLERQARWQQDNDRIQIKRLLQEAQQAEQSALSIRQSWIRTYGQKAMAAAKEYRLHWQRLDEFNHLRLLELQTRLEKTKNTLQYASQRLEQLRQESQPSAAIADGNVQADRQRPPPPLATGQRRFQVELRFQKRAGWR
ncbi:MAG: hypothetical protein HQL73_04300 [Magnetococcales bacterium]|nr:hypothetical protein [Magnetococcales bacterium]